MKFCLEVMKIMKHRLDTFKEKELYKIYFGMDIEKNRVIDTIINYLIYDKKSDYDTQILYRILRKLYPDSDFTALLTI